MSAKHTAATIRRCGEAANAAVSYAADRRCKSFQRYQLPARCCKRHTPLVPEERRGRSGSRPSGAGRLTGRHGRRNAVIRVRFPAGPPVASSSNGKDTCPSNRERGFNSRRGYQRRSSSNGQSAALRTRRLGDHTLRAAPAYRDRLAIGQLSLKQRSEV